MYARIHIFEDGNEVDLYDYTTRELDLVSYAVSSLTSMYNIDMSYGYIYDISNSFCEKFRNSTIRYRIYPKQGWVGVTLEAAFEIFYDDENEYCSEPELDDF